MKGALFRLCLHRAAGRARRKELITTEQYRSLRGFYRRGSSDDFEDVQAFVIDEAIRQGVVDADAVPAEDGDDRDWAGFFAALAEFFEKILPLILSLFSL